MLLTAADVADLLPIEACVAAVERAFAQASRAAESAHAMLGVHVDDGAFHVKAAVLEVEGRRYFVSKTNANFPANPVQRGLPTIQGILVLSDAETGVPLAVMDSMRVTELRTAAATGVAARHLARPESEVVAVVGCGRQGRAHLRVLSREFRLVRCRALDRDRSVAERYASEMADELGFPIDVAQTLRDAAFGSDIIVTCTTSDRPFLGVGDVPAGAFVAGVGADNPSKHELEPGLLSASRVVVDSLEQCRRIGDLAHAIRRGAISADARFDELGDIVGGRSPARVSADQRIVFDSTGTAHQDVAAAVVAYRRAIESDATRWIDFRESSSAVGPGDARIN